MQIWDGEHCDISNFTTDHYLQINSCGVQNVNSPCMTLRKRGRVDYHILLVTAGRCEIFHQEEIYRAQAGFTALYLPGETQKYVMQEGCSTLWCHFAGTIVPEVLDSCDLRSGVYALPPRPAIINAYTAMIRRYHQPNMDRHANAALLELLSTLADAVHFALPPEPGDTLMPIIAYINGNYNQSLTLDELAARAGYSKSRFSHLFTETMGISPIHYQNSLRLNAACELLTSTELTVTDVARQCGFIDPLYFSRCFRKKYAMSPTEYRKERK